MQLESRLRTRHRPRRIKKWLRSPHNKFKTQATQDQSIKWVATEVGESKRSQNDTKVRRLTRSRMPMLLIGALTVFISLSCCYLRDSSLVAVAQASQTKSAPATRSAGDFQRRHPATLDEEEVSIVRAASGESSFAPEDEHHQAAKSRMITTSSTQPPTAASAPVSAPTSAAAPSSTTSATLIGRRARRRPRVIKLHAAPMNGRLVGPAEIQLGHGEHVQINADDAVRSPVDAEQFGARAAATTKTSSGARNRQANGSRSPKMLMRPMQESQAGAGGNTTEPCPLPSPATLPTINAPTTSGPPIQELSTAKLTQAQQQQQAATTSVAASSPMLRLTSLTQAPGALASATPASLAAQPNRTSQQQQRELEQQPQVGTQASLLVEDPTQAEEGGARSSGGESIFNLIDEYDSKIITNRTRAQLSCDSGEMVLRLNFSDPFKGIVYPEHNRLSPCRFFGDGHHNYELRLPLRGCGTRQAAPRVFVNDVIVRFHKTLELEEDEVKTLICRYPPPLAPNPPYADGTHGHSDQRSSTAATIVTTSTTDGGNGGASSVEQEGGSQFEFVDSLSGRPRLPPSVDSIGGGGGGPGGSSGTIETSSDNLIISPQQQPDLGAGGYTNRLGPIRQQPPDLFDQRNSLHLDPSQTLNGLGGGRLASIAHSGAGGTNQRQQADGFPFASGFSSVELLFLISSLMFLVLMALGLAASYYCFRRHANRRSTQRASAILKRKRRYVSPANLLSAHQAAAALANNPAGMQPPQQQQQLYYQSSGAGGHQPPLTAPSSPESDLSARGLLVAGRQQASGYAPTRYALNHAFVPDAAKATVGQQGPHYLATTALANPYKQAQVLGRRSGNGGEHPSHHTQVTNYMQHGGIVRYVSPHRVHPAIVAQATGVAAATRYAPGRSTKHPGATPTHHWTDEQGNTHDEGSYAVSQTLSRAKSFNSSKHRREVADVRERQWVAAAAASGRRGQPATLSRAGRGAAELQSWTTLMDPQQQQVKIDGESTRARRPRQRAAAEDGDRWAEGFDCDGMDKSTYELNNNSPGENNKSTQQTSASSQTKPHKPKLLLKSIEDSYITNLIEIHEQEYIKRDSTRPLDLAEWRSMQPRKGRRVKKSPTRQEHGSGGASNSESGDDLLPPPPPPLSGAHQATQADDEEGYYQSGANLRSLTELDVNFARTLMSPAATTSSADGNKGNRATTSGTNQQALRPAVSADQLASATEHELDAMHQLDAAARRKGRERRASSVPEVATEPASHSDGDKNELRKATLMLTTSDSDRPPSESPDLILSPEYDCSRLELEQPHSDSSHNSVSYV